jgi:spore germination protein KC
VTEFEFVSKLVSKTTGAVAPLVKTVEKDDRVVADLHGCAVFKESRMVGTFDEKETRGLLFIENKVKTGVLLLPIKDTTATVEIREAKCKVKPVLYTDGTAAFNVEIDATVGLGDQTGTFNLADPENVNEMLGAAAAAIKEEVQKAVDKSKELGSDVFGFGEYLHRKYPEQWLEMQGKWDELYQNIKVNMTVNVKADGSGRIVMPLVPEGE